MQWGSENWAFDYSTPLKPLIFYHKKQNIMIQSMNISGAV